MAHDRYANLSPGAVVAALRSFPRRYAAVFGADPAADPDEVAARATADGRTVGNGLADTVAGVEHLRHAIDRVLVSDGPELPAPPAGPQGPTPSLTASLAQLEAAAGAIAARVESAPGADLLRTGTTAAGDRVAALDLARDAVRRTAEHLRLVERALGAADADADAED